MIDLKDIVRQEMEAINRRDFDKVRELKHEQYSFTGPDGQKHQGKQAGIEMAEFYIHSFPDLHFEIKHMITQGNEVVVEYITSGTHQGELMGFAPTYRNGSIPVCSIFEIRDEKIYSERQYFDNASILSQIGIEIGHEHA